MREVENKKWNKQYEKLVEFKRKNRHCNVPRGYQEDASLGNWVSKQRQVHAKNNMRQDRKDLLNKIGFVWNVEDHQWKKQYEKLVEFKRKQGNCVVPQKYEEDVTLGTWVDTQQQFHNQNTIRLDRKDLLDDIGFVWRVENDALWQQQYEKMVEFKRNNGHCLVPNKYKEDKSLGNWVSQQRQFHKRNKLPLKRKDLLDEIGFVWKAPARSHDKDKQWNKQYEKLVEFKRKNRHCNVPQKYEQDKSLGKWVATQRAKHVRQDRKELLDELGFTWRVRTPHQQYGKLLDVKQTNGNARAARSSTTNVSC
jgi:uncharacterized protein YbgA (DUF1722 family)